MATPHDISHINKLDDLCREWLNSELDHDIIKSAPPLIGFTPLVEQVKEEDKNFGKKFYELLNKPRFPFFTFTHELSVDDKYEFTIKVTKFPFSNPRIEVNAYNIGDKKDSNSRTYIIEKF